MKYEIICHTIKIHLTILVLWYKKTEPFLGSWPLKMGLVGSPETSVTNYSYSLCNIWIAQKSTFLIYITAEAWNHTKTESNENSSREHKQVSSLSWWRLSASGAKRDMRGLYFTVYLARMVAVYSEVQMFADLAECVVLHTPYKLVIHYHWLMHGATSPCLHPHIAPVLTSYVTSIPCTWCVSKWRDLIFLCFHSFIYSTLIPGSYHNSNWQYYVDTVKLFLLELFKVSAISALT